MNDREDGKALEVMTAADVMTAAPRTCSTFSTVLEAVMIFRDNDCGAVPILEEGKPVAILTDRDVALAISEFAGLASQTVDSIMTPGVVSVKLDDSLEDVCEVLRARGSGESWSSMPTAWYEALSAGPISRRSSRTGRWAGWSKTWSRRVEAWRVGRPTRLSG